MNRKFLIFTVSTVLMLILALSTFHVKSVQAQDTYTIEWVSHKVEILYDGHILVNDTLKITGNLPSNFSVGLPYKYGVHVLKCIAYPPSNPRQRYAVLTDVPLDGRMGFYGVNVNLSPPPENGIFSVFFLLSNNLLKQSAQNTSLFTLDFPAYPSLTMKVSSCNASLVLPTGAKYVTGTVPSYNYAVNVELPPFAYEAANVTFLLTTEEIQLFNVEELQREIVIAANGEVGVSDSYYVKNHSPKELSSIEIAVMSNAFDVTVEDEFGRKGKTPTTVDRPTGKSYKVELTFAGRTLSLKSGEAARFIVRYRIPEGSVIRSGKNGEINLQMFQNVRYYVKNVKISFIFPEGAKIVDLRFNNTSTNTIYGISRGIFQEKAILQTCGVFLLDSLEAKVIYTYSPFWLSFRPTLWVWALAMFTCAVIAVWRKLHAPPAPAVIAVPTAAVRLTPETLQSFVKAYEEKRKIMTEMKSLEVAVSRGRIPRRSYKVQKKTLEIRLEALERDLSELKLKIRSAGGRYADLMRQLEVAETEIHEVEGDIQSIEARHRRGELSLEAYRRLLEEYQRRREKAEATINGVLLRLREEAS
jgi:hypothetical protein